MSWRCCFWSTWRKSVVFGFANGVVPPRFSWAKYDQPSDFGISWSTLWRKIHKPILVQFQPLVGWSHEIVDNCWSASWFIVELSPPSRKHTHICAHEKLKFTSTFSPRFHLSVFVRGLGPVVYSLNVILPLDLQAEKSQSVQHVGAQWVKDATGSRI